MRKSFLFIAILSTFLTADDLTLKTTDELLGMRGTLNSVEERQALHNELTIRYESMNESQKESFGNKPGRGLGKGLNGSGRGNGNSMGQGMGRGRSGY